MASSQSKKARRQVPKEFTFGYKDKVTGEWGPPQPKQALAHACTADHLFYGGAAFGGIGGRCPERTAPSYNPNMETNVLGPFGFKLIGDIQVGDQVCNPDGTVARVVAVHDRGVQPFYRVTLSDGASVEADASHLWVVWFATARRRRKLLPPTVPDGLRPEDEWNLRVSQRCQVVTTKELKAFVESGRVTGKAAILPLTAPVAMSGPQGRWPTLPPYVIGVLLGDGSIGNKSPSFSCADEEIAQRVQSELGDDYVVKRRRSSAGKCPAWAIIGGTADEPAHARLSRDGLLGCRSWEKFIPARLKVASVSARTALIQGLFDTDGHMDARGHVEFSTVSEKLALDVRFVLRSLGCKVSLRTKTPTYTHLGVKKNGRLAYRLYVQGSQLARLFALPRKAERATRTNHGDTLPGNRVVSVEYTGDDRSRCLTVSHPNGLYVTDDFIVTHNSEFAIVEAIATCLIYGGCEVAVFRRKHTELKKSLVPRFRRLVPRWMAKFNKTDMCATFFNGSLLWFCHCQHEDDVYTYQSAEWLVLIVDEASHFTQFQIDYLITRARKSVPGWHGRVIFTSNPGNVGHGWLKRRFVAPAPAELGDRQVPIPGEVWRPLKTDPEDPTPPDEVRTRCFIPARSEDNPAGMKADPHYMAGVWALGGDKAKQLALGDWDANDSMIVGPEWRAWHVVQKTDKLLIAQGLRVGQVLDWHVVKQHGWRPPPDATIYGSVDYGFGAPWSFHLHAVYRTSTGSAHTRTFFEFYETKVRDVEQARRIREAIEHLMAPKERGGCGMARPTWIVGDPAMWNSRAEMGISKSVAEVYLDELMAIHVSFMKGAAGRGARVSRPGRWKDALSPGLDGFPQWSVTTACPHLIRTVPEVPWDEEDKEVEDDESENHCYEDTGRFYEARPLAPRVSSIDQLKHLNDDPISKAHQEMLAKKDKPQPKILDMTGLVK